MTVASSARGSAGTSGAGGPAAHEDPLFGALTPEELAQQWEAEQPPPAGPLANLGAALVVLVVGVLGVLGALQLGVGTPRSPGPGTWPLIVSLIIVTLGLVLAVNARSTTDTERFTRDSWAVLAGLASMAAFAALIDRIGFEVPAALLAFFWLRVLGRESWRMSIVGSVGIVAAFYLVFVAGLGVAIPHLF